MSGVLVIAESRRGELREVSLELVSAARAVAGGDGRVGVGGGARRRFVVVRFSACRRRCAGGPDGRDPGGFEPELWGAAVEALIDECTPSLVLCGHTIDSMGFAPAVAARRGLGFASDAIGLRWTDGLRVRRGAYGDKLVAELEFPGKSCSIVTVRAGIFPAAQAGSGSAPARAVQVALDGVARTEHVSFEEAAGGDVDITKAEFLLSIGRGIEDKDNIPRFEALAEKLGATLSSSRPLVDAGWMPSARQVGQSGKTVKPRVYLALGISGAVQHLAGMRNADTIIAVNTDPEAPIFGVAHYGAVADLFEVADELEALD